jgi:hypothetical protein
MRHAKYYSVALALGVTAAFIAPASSAQTLRDYIPQRDGASQTPEYILSDDMMMSWSEADQPPLILIAKTAPKQPRGKLTLKQKVQFKTKKYSLARAKTAAKKDVRLAQTNKKLAGKELEAAARVASLSRANLHKKYSKLNTAREKANARTGLSGRLARARVRMMEKSYLKSEAKHAAGPKARHDNARTADLAASTLLSSSKSGLSEARQALVTRKDDKNALRADNLAAAQAKKAAKAAARGPKPQLAAAAPAALRPERATPGAALYLAKPAAASNQTIYSLAPSAIPNVKDMHGYSKAPAPAVAQVNSIYGPFPPARDGN